MPSYRLLLLLPMLLLVGAAANTGCSKTPEAKTASKAVPVAAAAPAPIPAHAGAPPAAMPANEVAASASPAARRNAGAPPAGAAPPGAVRSASGRVLETMDAAGYTYIRLDTGTGQIWAATSQTPMKVGQLLTVPLEMPMRDFHSDKLGRTFPLIYFASAVSRGGTTPAVTAAGGGQATPAPQEMPPGHPAVGRGSAAAPITVTGIIPPAPGGRSVAQVWAERAALAGKTVVVRGKVVKFLSGIMGRNWMHLQDGTGDLGDGTNDITVTTTSEAQPGDIVTVTGTLAIDKDFGAGYRYNAIIEGATTAK